MQRQYQNILPKSAGRLEHGPEDATAEGTNLQARRPHVKTACNACRQRKISCDGNRPQCIKCRKKRIDCVYASTNHPPSGELQSEVSSLRTQLSQHQDFVDKLKYLPEKDAIDLVRALRTSANPENIIRHLSGAMNGRQRPSDVNTARAISPLTESKLEFELMSRHYLAYPRLLPIKVSAIKLSNAGESILRNNSSNPAGTSSRPLQDDYATAQWPIRDTLQLLHSPDSATSMTWDVNDICDSRLHNLHMEHWTSVPISGPYAAAVLSLYLQTDHPVLGTFDVDLVLNDMVARRPRFCSPFFVSSLMYLACQGYTRVDVGVLKFKHAFFDEAERYWQRERASDSIVNLSAITTLSIGCVFQGKDGFGNKLFLEARHMAERLGLLGVRNSETGTNREAFCDQSPEWVRAASHTAWGTFAWLGLHSIFYFDDPVTTSPNLLIPGSTKQDIAGQSHSLPVYMGHTFPSTCGLWTLWQEYFTAYTYRDMTFGSEEHLAVAESKYQELLHWADILPADMNRGTSCPAHVMIFHSFYHCVILKIFRPFLSHAESLARGKNGNLVTFASPDSSPKAASSASLNQLKRIIFDYSFLYQKKLQLVLMNSALVQVADASLRDRNDQDWRLYFLLCVRCWLELYICYPIFEDIVPAYLSMALRNGMLTTREAEALKAELHANGTHHANSERPTTSFTADFELALTNPDEAEAHTLAQRFGELSFFVDFTEGDYVAPEASAQSE